jgi:hypothetical protein
LPFGVVGVCKMTKIFLSVFSYFSLAHLSGKQHF